MIRAVIVGTGRPDVNAHQPLEQRAREPLKVSWICWISESVLVRAAITDTESCQEQNVLSASCRRYSIS